MFIFIPLYSLFLQELLFKILLQCSFLSFHSLFCLHSTTYTLLVCSTRRIFTRALPASLFTFIVRPLQILWFCQEQSYHCILPRQTWNSKYTNLYVLQTRSYLYIVSSSEVINLYLISWLIWTWIIIKNNNVTSLRVDDWERRGLILLYVITSRMVLGSTQPPLNCLVWFVWFVLPEG